MNALNHKSAITRLTLLALFLVTIYLLALNTNITQYKQPEQLKTLILQSGSIGIALYIALFSLGLLVYIPGMLFLISSSLIYGPVQGSIIALVGACIAVNVSFVVVRLIGGKPIQKINNQYAQNLLDNLHKRPIRNIALLRTVMITAPGFNYALALSNISFKDYFWGSLLGMILPVIAVAYFADFASGLFF